MHVYEKLDGISAWLLGFIALRELLLIQHKLGLSNAGAYNVDTCCASFITMFEIAVGLICAGIKKKVLIVASAIDSHINDKSTYFTTGHFLISK